MTTPHDDLIRHAAAAYGLPFDLVQAQVVQESAGRADAFRFEAAFYDHYIRTRPTAAGFRFGPLAACSYGLMQILLETALEIGFDGRPEDLFLPRIGLSWGCKKMRTLWTTLGSSEASYKTALTRYNGTGPAAATYADAIYVAAGRVA